MPTTKDVAYSRQIAMYLLREGAKISFPQIGEVWDDAIIQRSCSLVDKIKRTCMKMVMRRVKKDIDFLTQKLYVNAKS